jgi:hypothetical protein
MAAPVLLTSYAPFDGNRDLGAAATCVATVAGTYNTTRFQTGKARGVRVVIDITAITGTLTVTIQGYDVASGKAFTLLASTALAGTGTTVLKVHPDLTAASNLTVNDHIGPNFDIKLVSATGPFTATIGVQLLA